MEMLKCPGIAEEPWYERALGDLEQEENHVKEAEKLSLWVHKDIMKLLMWWKNKLTVKSDVLHPLLPTHDSKC